MEGQCFHNLLPHHKSHYMISSARGSRRVSLMNAEKQPTHRSIMGYLQAQVENLKALFPPSCHLLSVIAFRVIGESSRHSLHAGTTPAVLLSYCTPCPFVVKQWEAVEGNWLLLTQGCQNGDGTAVHFQFQPADWNLPLGSPVSQAPFSEPMVWKTWFNSCSMLFIRFSISPNRLSVASFWRSNCVSLWMEECNILW